MNARHTPGPWRWELNESTRHLNLVGGKPMFDLTIISPTRWGMSSATLLIRDTAFDGMNIMHKLHDRRDWVKPFPNRDHHARWCADVVHPDMRLIAEAPALLKALQDLMATVNVRIDDPRIALFDAARALVAKVDPDAPLSPAWCASVDAELAATAEADALKIDANRYRWLRQYANRDLNELEGFEFTLDADLDEAIDKAIAEGAQLDGDALEQGE